MDTLTYDVVEMAEGQRYRMTQDAPSARLKALDLTFSFEPVPQGTRLSVRFVYELKELLGPILDLLVVRREVVRMWETALPRIKDYVEREPATA